MMNALAIRGLALDRGDRRLIDGLDLDLRAGEVATLTGANGAGKTSLLKAVAGLIRPAAGRIGFLARMGEIDRRDAHGLLHYVGHEDGLAPSRRALDELAFWTAWSGGQADAAGEAARVFGLERALGLEVRRLSAGQRRRLALARLVAAPRPLWLLDEPFAALDAIARAVLEELIDKHLANGGLVLAAAHEPLRGACRTVRIGQ